MAWRQVHAFEGQRENSSIFHADDGYYYHKNNSRPQSRFTYLKCVKASRNVRKCHGSAKALKNMHFLKHMKGHYHGPDLLYPYEMQLRKEIKEEVRNGNNSSFVEIIQSAGEGYDVQVRLRLPAARLNSTLNRIRSEMRPPVPETLEVLGAALMEEDYAHITKSRANGQSIFAGVCGSMEEGTLSLVFISPWMRDFMSTRARVFSDGTWRKKCRVPSVGQIFTICGIMRHHSIHMLRAIMLRKTEEAYDCLLDYVKILMPNFNPTEIMCDFERAEINSWKKKFPNAIVEGCIWHYAVASWGNAISFGLHAIIEEEDVVSSIIRSICALPLLPTDEIEGGLEDLGWEAFHAGWMPELKEFFNYMEKEWMPRVDILSVCGAQDRTNNISETANRSYNKVVKVGRPSIFTILDAFVKLHDQSVLDIMSMRNGFAVSHRRKVSALRNDLRIQRFTEDFQNGDITRLEFLHKASRRMQGVFQTAFNLQ